MLPPLLPPKLCPSSCLGMLWQNKPTTCWWIIQIWLSDACRRSCMGEIVITASKPLPPDDWTSNPTNYHPPPCSAKWEEEIQAPADIILKLLQSTLLLCNDGGDGVHQFVLHWKVNDSCSSSQGQWQPDDWSHGTNKVLQLMIIARRQRAKGDKYIIFIFYLFDMFSFVCTNNKIPIGWI